jgi:predicted transcriptional regulator
MLGGLEQKIMEVLWASPIPLKPSEVLAKVNNGHAYTTIMTVLKRMTDKKLIKRELRGNTYQYQALQDKSTFAAQALEDLFARLFESYGDSVIPAFKKSAKKYQHK